MNLKKLIQHIENTTKTLNNGDSYPIDSLGGPLGRATALYQSLQSPNSEITEITEESRKLLIRRVSVCIEILESAFHGRRNVFDENGRLIAIEGNPDTKLLMEKGLVRIPESKVTHEDERNGRTYEIKTTQASNI